MADLMHSLGVLLASFGFAAFIGAGLVCGIKLALFVWPSDFDLTMHLRDHRTTDETHAPDSEYVRGWRDAMAQDNPPVEAPDAAE